MKPFGKAVNKVNLKLLTILAKGSNVDAWISLERVSASGYNTVLKSHTEIYPLQRVKMESFN